MSQAQDNWNNNSIQFPRLLAEIHMVGDLTDEQMQAIAESMSLNVVEVREIFDRAAEEFDEMKTD